jgi:hypothetical protein
VGGLLLLACCFLAILLIPLVLFLLTYVYRLACVLCGLPKPSVLTASGVMMVTIVSVALAESIMGAIVELSCDAAGLPRWEAGVITFFLFLPIDLVISSGIHAGLMGIRFGKGIEVWFVQRLITLALIAAVVFVAALVVLVQNLGG